MNPDTFYQSSPLNIKQELERFNILIHNYEKINRKQFLSPTITCTFDSPRYKLSDDDYQHFTYKWEFGTVYINYCEVGKHLLELFLDNDDIIGSDNIRPLEYYKSDFKIKFTTMDDETEFNNFDNRFKAWLTENHDKFKDFKHYSLGLIPVAKIITDADKLTVIKEIKDYTFVKSVRILDE